jgi:hypothetical protein
MILLLLEVSADWHRLGEHRTSPLAFGFGWFGTRETSLLVHFVDAIVGL